MTAEVGRRESEVDVSVIIPCFNSADLLGQQLRSLGAQRVSRPWEVIVVDAGSTDASVEVARSFSRELPLRTVELGRKTRPGKARNAGAQQARGRKLLFLDADDVADPGYVDAMSEALDINALVTSRLELASLNPEWVRDAHGEPWQQEGVGSWLGFLPSAGACNLGVTAELFADVGGFSADYAIVEDVAFTWRAQLQGVELAFVDSADLRYRYRTSLWALFRQTFYWGADLPLLYKEFRSAGMPARKADEAFRELKEVLASVWRSRSKRELAHPVVRLGYLVGRLAGSVRHRILYL